MYKGDEQTEQDLRLFRVLSRATRAVMDRIRADVERRGINQEHFIILELLYNRGPHPIQKISEIFRIPSGSITYVVDKLEKKGFVERQANPADRRVWNVCLTEQGQRLFNEIFPEHARLISRMFAAVDSDGKAQLIDMLKSIGLNAQQLSEEEKT